MDHVAEYHGSGILKIDVKCMDDIHPRRKKITLPKTPAEFYEFPAKNGWSIDDSFRLKPSVEGCDLAAEGCDLAVFLQAWLFFGLTLTVVQEDAKPVLEFDGMVNAGSLSTKKLHQALKSWSNWESREENRKGLRLRMIQVGYILNLARQVVRHNCAYINGEVWYNVDQNNDPLYISDEDVLVLMCLGETLSEVNAKIMKENKVHMAGWHHVDDHEGWGPPRYVFRNMEAEGWCPRAMRLLKGQFSSNATLLVSAYYAYRQSIRTQGHRAQDKCCTPEECFVVSKDADGEYQSKHICDNDESCKPFGPDQTTINSILKNNDIPLIRFRDRKGTDQDIEFDVIPFNPEGELRLEFVAISHVWSDGWGNEKSNQLNRCQLKFIQNQIEWVRRNALEQANENIQIPLVSKHEQIPFWMDTLVVPVGTTPEIKEAKKKAIRQIFDVFSASTHTIVIDNGLFENNAGQNMAEPAMKVLSSVWMRRLWTLQEAYLSRNIHFAFKDWGRSANSVLSLSAIEKRLVETQDEPMSGTARMVKAQLSNIIMGQQRRDGESNGATSRKTFTVPEAAIVVTNAWRAARWRATSRAEHETLALATLLGLNYAGSAIEESGLMDPGEKTDYEDRSQRLVPIFWDMVQASYPGAIPSGMIFLPGDKVNLPGYGWAPRTWLSAHEVDYPDPMNFWNTSTELGHSGLMVKYPGFILYTNTRSTRSRILGTTAISNSDGGEVHFSFPVDHTLSEWYSFTKADDKQTCPELTRLEKSEERLAVIMSRQPRESPREIALLVEIRKHDKSPDEDSGPDSLDYYVRVVHRVYIWREAKKMDGAALKRKPFRPRESEDFPVAEMLGTRQRWWVDGYVRKDKIPPGSLNKPGGSQSKPGDKSTWKRLLSSHWGSWPGRPLGTNVLSGGDDKTTAEGEERDVQESSAPDVADSEISVPGNNITHLSDLVARVMALR